MTIIQNALECQDGPAVVSVFEPEITLGIDVSANVGESQTVSGPESTLIDLETGDTVSLGSDTPTVVNNVINQLFRPESYMVAGKSYKWVVVYTLSSGNTLANFLVIRCDG